MGGFEGFVDMRMVGDVASGLDDENRECGLALEQA